MTKKLLYFLILISSALFYSSFAFAGSVSYFRPIPCPPDETGCCGQWVTYNDVSSSSCTMTNPSSSDPMLMCYSACGSPSCPVLPFDSPGYCSESPSGGGMCAAFQNSVGGCNNTPKYCSTSPVYQKVGAFLGVIGADTASWTYATVLGTDGVAYKCAVGSTTGTTVKIIGTYDSLKKITPQTSNRCLSPSEFTALINTNCDLSTGWAKNSGYVTNSTTGQTTLDPAQAEAPLTPPSGSTVTGPQGTPIDPSSAGTGFDSDKDGFDDVTGQPLPSSSGSGSGDSDGDGTDEVEIKDPEPDEIPAVPSGGEYDTEITAPEKTPLSGLFDIINSSPFISVIQGTHISLSGSQCLLTTANPVYGQYISFDFCDSNIVNILDYLGIIIVGIAAILAILLIFV